MRGYLLVTGIAQDFVNRGEGFRSVRTKPGMRGIARAVAAIIAVAAPAGAWRRSRNPQ